MNEIYIFPTKRGLVFGKTKSLANFLYLSTNLKWDNHTESCAFLFHQYPGLWQDLNCVSLGGGSWPIFRTKEDLQKQIKLVYKRIFQDRQIEIFRTIVEDYNGNT